MDPTAPKWRLGVEDEAFMTFAKWREDEVNMRSELREGPRHQLRGPEEYPAGDDANDRLRIPRNEYPEGFDLQWIAVKVFGQPLLTNRSAHERKGWEPVYGDDFQGQFDGRFLPVGHVGEIEIDGLVLMARPKSWSDRATAVDKQRARDELSIKEQQLKGGDLPKVPHSAAQHPSAVAKNRIARGAPEMIDIPDK